MTHFSSPLRRSIRLIQSDRLRSYRMDNVVFLQRKALIHQQFIRTQLSCYLPYTRTTTFVTKCSSNARIRPQFDIDADLPTVNPIEPPVSGASHRHFTAATSWSIHRSISNWIDTKPVFHLWLCTISTMNRYSVTQKDMIETKLSSSWFRTSPVMVTKTAHVSPLLSLDTPFIVLKK